MSRFISGPSASPFCHNTPSSSLTRKRPNSYKRLWALDIAVFRVSSEYTQARLGAMRITEALGLGDEFCYVWWDFDYPVSN
jgi:hypothetical protein